MIPPDSYARTLARLTEVREWLFSLDITSTSSYFNEIYQTLERAAIADKTLKISGSEYLTLRKALNEALIFIDIYDLLRSVHLRAEIVGKLKLATRIPDLDEEGTDSVTCRNHLFELHLASFLYTCNLNVTGFDDVQFEFDGFNFHIECKRPSSVKKIGRRIGDAYTKLKTTYVDSKSRGFIAISADKIVFPHEYLRYEKEDALAASLETFEMSTADDVAMTGSIEVMTKVFIEKYRNAWIWMPDLRLLGIMIVYRFMVNDNARNMLLAAFIPAIVPRCDPATLQGSDKDLLDRLRAHIALNGRKLRVV